MSNNCKNLKGETMYPQIILLILFSISLYESIKEHGLEKVGRGNAWDVIVGIIVINGLLWWGGFWAPLFGG